MKRILHSCSEALVTLDQLQEALLLFFSLKNWFNLIVMEKVIEFKGCDEIFKDLFCVTANAEGFSGFEWEVQIRVFILRSLAPSNVGFNSVYFLSFYSFSFLVVYLARWCFISLSQWYPSLTGFCLCCVHVCNHINTPPCQLFHIMPVTHSLKFKNALCSNK